MVQRVGAVGPHDLMIMREVGGIQRVADVHGRRDQGEEPRRAELERRDRHAEAQERRREDETGRSVGRPVLDVRGGDEPAEAVAEQIDRLLGLLLAHGVEKDGSVVEVVGETAQAPAAAARAAVAAQVVHVHRVASRRQRLGEPAVAAAVLAVPVDYGEHGGRLALGAPRLARQQETVGGRGRLGRFTDYLDDTAIFLDAVREEQPEQPVYLLGHSLGGLIAAAYVEDRPSDAPAGLILSSPFLRLGMPVPPLKLSAARLLSLVAPAVNIGNTLDPADLSHDHEVVRAYGTDPLNHHVATARWAAEVVAAQSAALSAAGRIRLPLLLLYADADAVADP